ncbi:hypothetical protein BGX27_007473, partial [Mortierella sp. AM989]
MERSESNAEPDDVLFGNHQLRNDNDEEEDDDKDYNDEENHAQQQVAVETRVKSEEDGADCSNKESSPFDTKLRASFLGHYEALGRKWILESGTIVEDRLFKIGLDCMEY